MEIKIDSETGEILPGSVMVTVDKMPAVTINLSDVELFYSDPQKLVDKISIQAGNPVFDITTKKGRDECKSNAAQIIRCISPAEKESKRLDADYAKKIKQGINFRKSFDAGVREIAALHRKPLTEWENEQERIKQEQIDRENARIAEEKYQLDWQDAIDFDELYTLRKARELTEQIAEAERKAIADKLAFEAAVIEQAETMRLQIEADAKRKAEAEQAAKLEQERAVIREEEAQKARTEQNRLDRIKAEEAEAKRLKDQAEIEVARHNESLKSVEKDTHKTEQEKFESDPLPLSHIIRIKDTLVNLKRPHETSFYSEIEIEPTVFKADVEMVTIPKSEYDELISRSERLFELEMEFS